MVGSFIIFLLPDYSFTDTVGGSPFQLQKHSGEAKPLRNTADPAPKRMNLRRCVPRAAPLMRLQTMSGARKSESASRRAPTAGQGKKIHNAGSFEKPPAPKVSTYRHLAMWSGW